jgi:hypothetical protein
LSSTRRLDLLNRAQSSGSWIIEDDYDSEYRYESMPVASLQGLELNPGVIYIGAISKVLFPSLRIGSIVMPADLVGRFSAMRFAMDFPSLPLAAGARGFHAVGTLWELCPKNEATLWRMAHRASLKASGMHSEKHWRGMLPMQGCT